MNLKKPISNKEKQIVTVIFLFFFFLFSFALSANWYNGMADTSMNTEVIENVARTGFPYSQILSSNEDAYKLWTFEPDDYEDVDLKFNDYSHKNFFRTHTYFIIYLIAPITWFVPANILMPLLIGLSALGLLYLIYFFLRNNEVSIIGSVLFVLMISMHPAWSRSMFGQSYTDRIFYLLGILFILAVVSKKPNIKWVIITSVLAAMITERFTVYVGMFIVMYSILYWGRMKSPYRLQLFGFGSLLILIGLYLFRFYLNSEVMLGFYSRTLSNSVHIFTNSIIVEKLILFLIFNLILLLIFGVFEWRAALIAFGAMLPNVFGNIGGAEKIGWLTHYHVIYFPILVWATATGFIKLYSKLNTKLRKGIISVLLVIMVVLMGFLNPYSYNRLELNGDNFLDNAWFRAGNSIYDLFDKEGSYQYKKSYRDRLRDAVPEGSIISVPEYPMVMIFQNRITNYYPTAIEDADYVILHIEDLSSLNSPYPKYRGAVSYNGPDMGVENRRKVDEYLVKRLEKIGYDIHNPVVVDNTVVIKNFNK